MVANPYRVRGARGAFEAAHARFVSTREKLDAGADFARGLELLHHYEHLSSILYRIRGLLPESDPYRRRAEDLVATLAQELFQRQAVPSDKGTYERWVYGYRRIWRENQALFGFTVLLFVAGSLVGWNLAITSPSFVGAMFAQPMLENILDNRPWFESLQKNPLLGGFQIALNNIRVAINTFLGGALLGLGGFWLLLYNGLMFGGIFGFCRMNHFDEPLRNFVIGHGPLELTIIVAAAFASFILGRAFYRRPLRELPARLARAGRESSLLVTGILPWLALAAFIEAFISPQASIDPEIKFGIGAIAAALFWLWTFWPVGRLRSGSSRGGRNRA